MLKKTTDPWCSAKGLSKLRELVRDMASLCDNPAPALADRVRAIHYDLRSHTIAATDGKKGVILSLQPGPGADAFMASMVKAQVSARNPVPEAPANAMDLMRVTGRLTVMVDGSYRSDNKYPNLCLMLASGPDTVPTVCSTHRDIPPDRMARAARFIERYGDRRGPWMEFAGAPARMCALEVDLDQATRASALVFAVPAGDEEGALLDERDASVTICSILQATA